MVEEILAVYSVLVSVGAADMVCHEILVLV